jgi:hypothetical protein
MKMEDGRWRMEHRGETSILDPQSSILNPQSL